MVYEYLPKDPFILLSFINTKLRDEFDNLAKLCANYNIDEHVLMEKLGKINYSYNKERNQFI